MPSDTFFIKSFSFFPDIDCRIHIPVHPVSTLTDILSIRQCQFLFLMSAYTADLAGCKITVYFYKILSTLFQFVPQHGQELPVPIILQALSKMQASGHALQVQIFHTYRIISFCKPPAEFMLEIFSLVLYLFMAQRYSLLLFLKIPASFFTVGEFPLFPYKFFLCFPVKLSCKT